MRSGGTHHTWRQRPRRNGTRPRATGARSPGPVPENATPSADVWVEYTRNATALAPQLRTIPRDDHATWAKAARVVSGAFAAWSYRLEATPGPLAAVAVKLNSSGPWSKTSWPRSLRRCPRPSLLEQSNSRPKRLRCRRGLLMLPAAARHRFVLVRWFPRHRRRPPISPAAIPAGTRSIRITPLVQGEHHE